MPHPKRNIIPSQARKAFDKLDERGEVDRVPRLRGRELTEYWIHLRREAGVDIEHKDLRNIAEIMREDAITVNAVVVAPNGETGVVRNLRGSPGNREARVEWQRSGTYWKRVADLVPQ